VESVALQRGVLVDTRSQYGVWDGAFGSVEMQQIVAEVLDDVGHQRQLEQQLLQDTTG
jgi:hypothetical protein